MIINSLFLEAKSWPFEEARRLLERVNHQTPEKGYVLFETGYGPSGLPHIGTFGEVARTSMVRHAFSKMCSIPTRLFAFSDDMDGLRKVPDNIPNPERLREFLGKPLSNIPDPFEKYESFAHHNNAMLCDFLDSFNFSYEFQSSTQWYKSGKFDSVLKSILEHYDEVMGLLLPTLRDERRKTYSPFLPICPKTGIVLQVPLEEIRPHDGTIVFKDHDNHLVEVPVTGGHCKLQWKVDWGMRWVALDVDYEMSGKDLIDSVKISSKIARILKGRPPENLTYELFLDEQGEKISKSKGNGLTIDEWLRYAPKESLSYYMYQAPRRAKRLHFDIIPRSVDEYLSFLQKYSQESEKSQLESPIYHIHEGDVPSFIPQALSFTLLLNLASVCHAENDDILRGFVKPYLDRIGLDISPFLDHLINYAVSYYHDFIEPNKVYKIPNNQEIIAFYDLAETLAQANDLNATDLQHLVFEVGKKHGFSDLKAWFGLLYEVLLGQKEGPRMGSFIALYGIKNTVSLIKSKIKGC